MKILRFLGMTLLMVMLAVNFTACSDDEDNKLIIDSVVGVWVSETHAGAENDYINTMVAGINKEGKGKLYGYDPVGTIEDLRYDANGSGSSFAGPLLDSVFGTVHRNTIPFPEISLKEDTVNKSSRENAVEIGCVEQLSKLRTIFKIE